MGIIRLFWPWPTLLFLLGWTLQGAVAAASPTPSGTAAGIVYVVDGAGGFPASARTLRQTIEAASLPLEVRSFRWTHGYCRVLADEMHATHLQRQGRLLADVLVHCRQQTPNQPLFLVGHSAGCGLVLNAIELLPPNTVERIVLLAPAVSVEHDLRPALVCARRGIDVFISDHDWACLSLGVCLAGTTDRRRTLAAAGKVGFQSIITCPADELLYAKLRQHPWNPSLKWTGHKGGHFGCYQPGFLRVFVLPLLDPTIQQGTALPCPVRTYPPEATRLELPNLARVALSFGPLAPATFAPGAICQVPAAKATAWHP
jgi:pimeloyl-ACP methyl ester carboxylesterase